MRPRYGRENELNLGLLLALYRAVKNVRRREVPVITARGVTFPQFEVLEALYHLGELTVSQLIEKTLSSIGNVSVVLDHMEADGYLSRRKSRQDRRVTVVRITARGRRLMERIFPEHLANVTRFLDDLSVSERRSLTRLLIKLEKSAACKSAQGSVRNTDNKGKQT